MNLDIAAEMLAKAGVLFDPAALGIAPFSDGRTGASVTRITTGEQGPSFVLKVLPAGTWRDGAIGRTFAGEGALWLDGITRDLPAPIGCPMLFADRGKNGEWRMLMRDVSKGIRRRGAFSDEDEKTFVRAIAHLHAHYWERPKLGQLPVLTAAETMRFWADPLVALLQGPDAVSRAPAWIRRFLSEFIPMTAFAAHFVDLLGEDDARFYMELARDRFWHRELDEAPHTLLHGDLRRANISFEPSTHSSTLTLTLIDWEFASVGPAVVDLSFHWWLHFWAYPNDDREPDDRPELLELYLDSLENALGRAVDRRQFFRAWDFAWLRALVIVGYCLADAVCGNDVPPERVARVRERSRAAIARARRILATL